MIEKFEQQTFAVLIDGDNAQASLLPQTLAEVSKYGLITIKRIYGDWTTQNMKSWKTVLHKYAFQPIQQFRYTVRKNATDSAMIIDAMDLLHCNELEGFCIVSSDSDYTRLATRIREDGLFVIGVGEKKTPEAFINACNQFIYCENLVNQKTQIGTEMNNEGNLTDPKALLLQALNMVSNDEGWSHLSTLGHVLRKLEPAFDPRSYGHQRLLSLIQEYPKNFVIKRDDSKTPPIVYVAMATQQSKR